VRTLVTDPFMDDASSILEWGYGPMAKQIFLENIRDDNQRTGQAFMNTLRMYDNEEYRRISGSFNDPFYADSKLPAAIDLLTSK
jgi:hypothetical protein